MTDNFEFELMGGLTAPFAGYVSSGDPTILSPQVMIAGSQNAYKALSGAIANRSGLLKRGVADNTQAPVISSFEWESSLGLTRPVRQCNAKLQVEFNPGSGYQWYDLLTGLPSNVCSYAPWYNPNEEKDFLLIVNGQQQINAWGGGVGLIATAANTPGIIAEILNPNNITNGDTGEFSSGGTGYAVGDVLTVEGGDGDALLVVDAIGSGGVASVTIDSGGSEYSVGDIVSIAYASGGPIADVDIAFGGAGYAIGDTVTTGNGSAVIEVTDVDNDGVVLSLEIQDGGTGYTSSGVQATSVLSSQRGAGLTVTYTSSGGTALLKVTGETGGVVTSAVVLTSGTGYAVGSDLTTNNVLTSASPSGLTVNITGIGNPITAWHFKNNGDGYVISPSLSPSATSGGNGTGATVWIERVVTGRVTISGSDTLPELGFDGDLSPTDGSSAFSGGSFLVGDTEWSYTVLGDDGNSFIGFSSDPSSIAGSVAISLVTITDTSPTSDNTAAQLEESFTNDAIAVVNNQVHLICYSSRLVHISSSRNYTHYDVAQLNSGVIRTPGYPDLFTGDSNVRAVGVQNGSAVIFGSLGDSYLITRKPAIYNQGSDFEALSYEEVTVAKEKSSDLSSPLGQDFLDYVGDVILFLDGNNQLREYGTVRNIVNPVYPVLSIDVYTELSSVDFTGGQLRCVGEEGVETIYLTAPKIGTVYLYQIRQTFDAVGNITSDRLWQSPFIWNVSRIAIIDGISYGHSNGNPMIFQLWNTGQWHDDSPSGNPLPYISTALFAYSSSGRRQGKTVFDKIYYEGYTTVSSTLIGIVNLEYLGSLDIYSPVITSSGSPATFFGNIDDNSLGQHSLGDEPLGDETQNENPDNTDQTRVKFRCICGVTEANVYEYGLGVTSQDVDDRWELLFIGPNAMIASTDQASDLMK